MCAYTPFIKAMRSTLRNVLAKPHKPLQIHRCHTSNQPETKAFRRVQLGYDEQHGNGDGGEAPVNVSAHDKITDWADEHKPQLSPPSAIRRSVSGIQPTGVPHLGNYLGALRQWKQLHDQALDARFAMNYRYEQYFSVVDLHALTSDIPGSERARLRKESYAALLAIGLRNNIHTTLFFQSDVSELLDRSRVSHGLHKSIGLAAYVSDVDSEYHCLHWLLVPNDSMEGV